MINLDDVVPPDEDGDEPELPKLPTLENVGDNDEARFDVLDRLDAEIRELVGAATRRHVDQIEEGQQ